MSRSCQKLTRFFAILLLIAVLGLPSSLCEQWNSLDTDSDSRRWKIEGNFIYVSQLPPQFPSKEFTNVRGIWIIVPNSPFLLADYPRFTPDYLANSTNTVKFSFHGAGKLLDNVNIKYRYNSPKNSTLIKVTTPKASMSLIDGDMSDGWYNANVSLDPYTNWIQIEATAHETGDFILIDRILVTNSGPGNDGCHLKQLALAGMITVSSFLWNRILL